MARSLRRHKTATLQACPQPYDLPSINRPDLTMGVVQLLIIKGSVAYLQGQMYVGEIHVNTLAIADDVNGAVVFILKLQEAWCMPKAQADAIVKLIMAVDLHLPRINRGKRAIALNGYMKSTLERHSCNGGDFGYFNAMRKNSAVAKQVLHLLSEVCRPLQSAFPGVMLDICTSVPPSKGLGQWFKKRWYPFSSMSFTLGDYAVGMHKDSKDVGMGFIAWFLQGQGTPPVGAVFQFPEFGLSFTPGHGSMVTFQPSQVLHGTRLPDEKGQGCQRIGLALSLQRRAVNVAIAEHRGAKRRVAIKQEESIAVVKTRRAKGLVKDGTPMKKRKVSRKGRK